MNRQLTLSTSIAFVLGGFALMAVSRPANAAWTFDNPPGTSQCTVVAVNDLGTKVLNCLKNNTQVVYFKAGSAAAVQLPALSTTPGSVPCIAKGMSTNAGTGIVSGACRSTNNVWQAVRWDTTLVGDPITLLTPLPGLLGLAADVRTVATAIVRNGQIAGESFSNNDTGTPVFWSVNGTGSPTALKAPLLESDTNCIPASIGASALNGVLAFVGNCPSGANPAASAGTTVPVLWLSANGTYIVLPKDPTASYCLVTKMNLSGQVLGQCIYGTDTYKVVRWAAGGTTAPVVMANLDGGGAVLRSAGVDMNNSGVITGTYLSGAPTSGELQTFFWDPAGGTSGEHIESPLNGTYGVPVDIADNNVVFGNYYVQNTGLMHPFHVPATSADALDDHTCSGGFNNQIVAGSPLGALEMGVCTDGNGNSLTVEQPTSIP